MTISIFGRVEVNKDGKDNILICKICDDFGNYYKSLVEKLCWQKFNLPRAGTHLTILDDKYHNSGDINWRRAKELVGNKIELFYDPERLFCGGSRNDFTNFYFEVQSIDCWEVRRKVLGRNFDPDRKPNFHITICNNKGKESNENWPQFWPQMIEVKEKVEKKKKYLDPKKNPVIVEEDKNRYIEAFGRETTNQK